MREVSGRGVGGREVGLIGIGSCWGRIACGAGKIGWEMVIGGGGCLVMGVVTWESKGRVG